MKKAIAYIRVSTDAQAEDGFGKDDQREIILNHANKHGYEIVRWVSDLGVSGASDIRDRKELREIIYGDITNPPYEVVITAKSDRISRDVNIYYGIRYLLSQKNIELVSAEVDFGQFGAFAPVIESMLSVLSELERDKITARTSGGRKQKAKRGGYAGGRAPFGYKVQDGGLVINEDESPAVIRAFELRKRGESIRGIANIMGKEGYKSRRGTPITFPTISNILDNERTYRGEYKYGESDWVQGQHEPILD